MKILNEIPHGRHFLASFAVPFDEKVKLLSKLQYYPQIQSGVISGTAKFSLKSAHRLFTESNSSYPSYEKCSGGAVIIEDAQGTSKGLFLLGILTELMWQSASDSPLAFEILSDEEEPEERTSLLSVSSALPAADLTPPSKVSEGSTPPQHFQLNSTDAQLESLFNEDVHLEAAGGKKSSQMRFVIIRSDMGNSGWDEKEILKNVQAAEVFPVDSAQSMSNDLEIVISRPHAKKQKKYQQSRRAKSKSKQHCKNDLHMSALSENPDEE